MAIVTYGLTATLLAAVAANLLPPSSPSSAKAMAKRSIGVVYKTQDQAQSRQDVDGYMAAYAQDVVQYLDYTPYRWHNPFAQIQSNIRGEFNPLTRYSYEPPDLEKIARSASTRIVNFSINQAGTEARVYAVRHWKMSGNKPVRNVIEPEYLLFEMNVNITELDVWRKDVTGWHITHQDIINRDDTRVSGSHTISGNFMQSFH